MFLHRTSTRAPTGRDITSSFLAHLGSRRERRRLDGIRTSPSRTLHRYVICTVGQRRDCHVVDSGWSDLEKHDVTTFRKRHNVPEAKTGCFGVLQGTRRWFGKILQDFQQVYTMIIICNQQTFCRSREFIFNNR